MDSTTVNMKQYLIVIWYSVSFSEKKVVYSYKNCVNYGAMWGVQNKNVALHCAV